ncbi:sulfotransferase family protein [Dapis sp. BLCC M229]|uniref:sulfotransferase family protein n=1 Tax=Dapis sp. BLCC M229 TaxID=3400188 RepID=UPI003CE6D264
METSNQVQIGSNKSTLEPPPIFILGVPRSGTTLLRMMIDSHPEIMCGPEAPWITNQQLDWAPSLRSLTRFLTRNEWGAVKAFKGVEQDLIYQLMANFIDEIMSASARSHGKIQWAEKTPRNIIALPFLYQLFPHAKFVHIYRDGRDVALSTVGKWKTIPISDKKVKNNYKNALKRWVDWNQKFCKDAKKVNLNYISIRYEDLVTSPQTEIGKLLEFLEVEWSDKVLEPHAVEHDIVTMKGAGMQTFFNRNSIDTASLYRWKKELNWLQKRTTKSIAEETLLKFGYEPTM